MTSITKADDSGGRPTYVGLGAPIDPCVSLSLSLSLSARFMGYALCCSTSI